MLLHTDTEISEVNSSAVEKTELHISEETDDDVFVHTPTTTHTTEDLFTIIHRYKISFLTFKHIHERILTKVTFCSQIT